jgi:hypothetical protein
MQVTSTHNLKTSSYGRFETLDASKAVISSVESSDAELEAAESEAAENILYNYGNRFMTEEQDLNVIIRGDCAVNLICGYGY